MGTILPFLKDEMAFEPSDVRSMSIAFDDACKVLKIAEADTRAREVVAGRIIELAGRGEHSPMLLRDRVLKDAGITVSEILRGLSGTRMSTIKPLFHNGGAFDPEMAEAMAMVVEQVCEALSINGDTAARETIAIRIVELARQGERDPDKLRDRLLRGANNLTGM